MDIKITVHESNTSKAHDEALAKCIEEMKDKCYAYFELPYDFLAESSEPEDESKPKTELPNYENFVKSYS